MALGAALVWETRASGANDNNGGAYLAGAGTTDYSQQNAAQLTLTDLATSGVVTTLTSVTGGFTAQMVGNVINIASGTNFTAGFYQITVFTNSNTVTLDRAPSTAAGSAGTGSVGGALATLGKLAGAMIASNKAYVTGAFTITAGVTFAQAASGTSSAAPPTRVIGYSAARGDSGHATVTLSTNTGIVALASTNNGVWFEQIDVDCASLGTSTGIRTNGALSLVRNCKVSNFTTRGIDMQNALTACTDCEVTGGTAAAAFAISTQGSASPITRCFVHDNACPGIGLSNSCNASWNLVVNNSGASSDGIQMGSTNEARNNTVHNNGRDGIRVTANAQTGQLVRNNILSNNAGFGFNFSVAAMPAGADYDGNAYYSNTSGARNNADSTTGIYGVSPYTNVRDVTLSASPYVGGTTGTTANFALNATAGGGAACKAAGTPGTWPGNTGTTGKLDMGAVQHPDTLASPGIIMATG